MSIAGIKHYLKKRGGWFFFLSSRGLLNGMDDAAYLTRIFHYSMGYPLDLEHPRTFNEKLQWLKLHDRKPLYTQMVDKLAVKDLIAKMIGPEYVIPVVGGPWSSAEEVDFDALPEQFVLKCTHDSGGLVVCRDKAALDREAVRDKLRRCLGRNYFWSNREWPYLHIEPRIFAERYMQDGQTRSLNVYKIFNFSGKPFLIQSIQNDKQSEESIDYFDTEWHLLQLRQGFPNSAVPLPKPETLPEMLRLAAQLSEGFPFLRTDFFEVNGRVYFSEFTFYTDSGLCPFEPPSWDEELGRMIHLPISDAT